MLLPVHAASGDGEWHSELRIPAIWLGTGGTQEVQEERVLGRSSDGGHGTPNVCGILGEWVRISRRHTQLRFVRGDGAVASALGTRVEVTHLSLNPCTVHSCWEDGVPAREARRLTKGDCALLRDGDLLHLHASLPVMFVVRVGRYGALLQEEAASDATWGWQGVDAQQQGTPVGAQRGGKRGHLLRSVSKDTPPLRKRLPAARSWDTPPISS